MARPISTEQLMGVSVCDPVAVMVIREEFGSLRYCSFSGFCRDLISMAASKNLLCCTDIRRAVPHFTMESSNSMGELPKQVVTAQNESLTLPAGSRFGRYEILGALGAGGMGEVYRARDTRLGRDLAIKILSRKLSDSKLDVKRFEREAGSASTLNHPNIVTIFELGQVEATYYIAMELVEGDLLREMLRAGPIPLQAVIRIAAQIADGLAKAHVAGVVHRDMKPENVMVSRDGLVKILDFGLAKLVSPNTNPVLDLETVSTSETNPGALLGTLPYMSPEQASGLPLDFRSDQFSFGSLLYEMVTGKRAFPHHGAAQTLAAILRYQPEAAAS